MALYTLTVNASDVPSTQSNFPAYFDLSRAPASFWSTVSNGGGDIRCYSDEAKTTELPREVVSCDTSTETGELHVKFTSLTSTSSIYIDVDGIRTEPAAGDTYGRNAVWSDYHFVYHGGTTESTGGVTLSNTAFSSDDTTNKPFGAASRSFDGGGDDQIETDFNARTAIGTGDFTAQTWARHPDDADRRTMFSFNNGAGYTDVIELRFGRTSDSKYTRVNAREGATGENQTGGNFNDKDDTFRLYHVTRTGSTIELFANATSRDTTTNAENAVDLGATFSVGGFQAFASQTMNGEIDEMRIRGAVLSDNWITTEYNNQSDESGFWGTWATVSAGATFVPKVQWLT